jgi:hypothetical protein
MTDPDDTARPDRAPWRLPTRRAFVALLGAATAAVAVRDRGVAPADEPPRSPWNGTTRWIGHC